jgi:hypothetical protein
MPSNKGIAKFTLVYLYPLMEMVKLATNFFYNKMPW